ncbi:cytochrome P450 736A117-like [Spinacia oleracea]|uniref:Cytochrome P450 736A117-like n=1 Tax=Spinacia oleracea TaxID=3562 RepID=A0A9R0IZT8_SPIOL|nr:cytochrome P450 736A117-like [Spinacia oleracea]
MVTMFSLYLPYFDKLVFHPFFFPTVLLFIILYYKSFSSNSGSSKNNTKMLPPSPPKLPIIGNLHQIGLLPHRSLQSLSQKYGKLMLLKLGSKQALVVSSVDAAREIMRTNDVNFSNRPKLRASSRLFSNGKDVAFAPYGDSWRKMKSMCVMQLLSNKKVESFRRIREEETLLVVEKLNRSSSSVVNLTEMVMTYAFDVTCRASFGKKYSKNHDNNFEDSITEALKLLGEFFLGDFVPGLSWIDRLTGLEGRLEKVAQQLDSFLEKPIHEQQVHLNTKTNIEDKSFVDILLEDDDLALDSIKAVVLDMFAAGVDTIYTLVEWVIVELLRHPEEMRQVEEEVRKQMKGKDRRVSDDDLKDLSYLKAVIKEALRMHPPGPLLVFRESLKDTKVNGFNIDAETLVIINAWAIQNDPMFWEEPGEFRPERFMNGGSSSSFDFKGQDFQYIPFGSGRRSCPGVPFAIANAELMIATLMFEFDLKLPDGCEMLDMAEIAGLTVRRRDPLMIIAAPPAF